MRVGLDARALASESPTGVERYVISLVRGLAVNQWSMQTFMMEHHNIEILIICPISHDRCYGQSKSGIASCISPETIN